MAKDSSVTLEREERTLEFANQVGRNNNHSNNKISSNIFKLWLIYGLIHLFLEICEDKGKIGAKDDFGLDCNKYLMEPSFCKLGDKYKNEDLDANKDCCGCGGGTIPTGKNIFLMITSSKAKLDINIKFISYNIVISIHLIKESNTWFFFRTYLILNANRFEIVI